MQMREYHKIQTVFLRDPASYHRVLLEGQWALPEFAYLSDNQWAFTEKVDGTNLRVFWNGETVVFGGRTDNAQIFAPLIQRLMERFPAERFAAAGLPALTLYGEGYGAKIQKGGGNYKLDGVDVILFDVWCGLWLERHNVEDIGDKLDLPVVPIVGFGTLHDLVELVRGGLESRWGNFPAEGVVARPTTELLQRNGHRIITKLKMKDFMPGHRRESNG